MSENNSASSGARSIAPFAAVPTPFSGLRSFIAECASAAAASSAPRTVATISSVVAPVSSLAAQKYTPKAASYPSIFAEQQVMLFAAVPTGADPKACGAWLYESARLQYASIAATAPAAYYKFPAATWRMLAIVMSAVRMGAACFLGSFPNRTCSVTAAVIQFTGNSLVQNASAMPLTGEHYTFASARHVCARVNRSEAEAMRVLFKYAPRMLATVAAMTVRQLSVVAFTLEMRTVRNFLRDQMSKWAFTASGLYVDMVWEVSIAHMLHGYSVDYLTDVLALPYFHLAVEIHNGKTEHDRDAAISEMAEVLTSMAVDSIEPAPAVAEPLPESELEAFDDSRSVVAAFEPADAAAIADLPEIVKGLGYDYGKLLPNAPNSVLAGGETAEEGF